MFILEGNEGPADEVREVEGGCVVHRKLPAEVDVFFVQAVYLGRDVVNRVLVLIDIVLDIFVVLGHHFLTHSIQLLHLVEVETKSNRGDLGCVLYVWVCSEEFVETTG